MNNKNNPLTALTAATLALPGLAHSQEGDYRSDDVKIDYNRSTYNESGNRIDVDVDQLSVTFPIASRFDASLTYIRDKISGASPVLNLPSSDGRIFQVLEAGATIQDERDVYEVQSSYYGDNTIISVSGGRSEEDDYISRYGSATIKRSFNNKARTVTVGYAFNNDTVSNTFNPNDIFTEPTEFNSRRKKDFILGFSQILNKNSVLELNATYIDSEGDLSDPYKKVYVGEADQLNIVTAPPILGFASIAELLSDDTSLSIINNFALNTLGLNAEFIADILPFFGILDDTRPDDRGQFITSIGYKRFFETSRSAIHVDYRLNLDDWGANSHTFDARWNFDLGNGWLASPSVRYFSQDNADFYNLFFTTIPGSGEFSSDYRLSAFGAISLRLGITKTFVEKYTIHFNYENYDRKHGLALGGGRGDSLDDYKANIISLTFGVKI